MFHLELRQFPHNTHAFNLTERELLRVLVPWTREQWIELGERKWNPHEARLTVLEGARLSVQELALGRGWRNAQHGGEDVTERMLTLAAGVGDTVSSPSASSPPPASPDRSKAGKPTSLSGEQALLVRLLGAEHEALLQAWALVHERRPELAPSEALALAEATLTSLDAPAS